MRSVATLFLAVFTLLGANVNAQLTVDSLSIQQYVQDVLLGSGIQATNITFQGCLSQVGYLQNGNSIDLGLNSGILLSSGPAQDIPPAEPQYGFIDFDCPAAQNDADLLNIANSVPGLIGQNFNVTSINDKAILEFDFIPTGDTLRFRYIFGSYEYTQYENSQYNDVFAFLLSGPGITGPYAAPAGFPGGAQNIAVIPDSNPAIPITISSVNATLNSEYFVPVPNQDDINARGRTDVLECWAEVVCGETYHIKLAIADGSDTALDSFVLLEEGSFSSNAVVDVNLSINVGGPDAETLWEDCGEATLTFTRAEISNLDVEDMVIIEWTGDAEMGVDYSLMPDTIFFPIGVSTVSFEIDAFLDGLPEGAELVHLDILNLGACNGSGLVSNFEFYINDHPDPIAIAPYENSICLGATDDLIPEITGGYGNFIYDWSTGETTSTITVEPLATTTYFLTVSDTCGLDPADGTFLINILVFDPLEVSINSGDLLLNCNESVDLTANATGGDGVYQYFWYDEDGNDLFGWDNTLFYGSWNGEGEINIEVTDGCGFTATDGITVELNVPDLIVDGPATVAAPCNSLTTVTLNVSGGQAPYNYSWELDGVFDWNQFDNTFDFTSSTPGTITATVNDGCGQSETLNIPYTIDAPPVSFDLIDELTGTCADIYEAEPTNLVAGGNVTYVWTEGGNVISNTALLSENFTSSTTVTLTITDACSSSASDNLSIVVVNPPISLDLGEDIDASCVDLTTIVPTIAGGSGSMQYSWYVADTLFNNATQINVQSFETVPVQLSLVDDCGETATDMLFIHIPNVPITFVTSADTTICVGGEVSLFGEASGGEGGFTYDWLQSSSTSTTMSMAGINLSTTFTLMATDICGKFETADINVGVMPVEAVISRQELDVDHYLFTSASTPSDESTTLQWYVDEEAYTTDNSFDYSFDGIGEHIVHLTATNAIGCTDSTYQIILSSPIVYIPNAFSPNGDGINDVFRIEMQSVQDFELTIFNRWGDVVFHSIDPTEPWLGEFKNGEYYNQNGVYNYVIKVRGFKNEVLEKTGYINVMR